MRSKKSYGAIALMVLGVGLLVAACGGGGGSAGGGTGGAGGTGGTGGTGSTAGTLTFTGLSSVSTISGLGYSSLLSNSGVTAGGTIYYRSFMNIATGGLAQMNYYATTTQDTLTFTSTANVNAATVVWYNAGPPLTQPAIGQCWVGGASNPSALPTCTSWGIAASRVAGTVAFTSTPVYNTANIAATGTMSGSLTFPPF